MQRLRPRSKSELVKQGWGGQNVGCRGGQLAGKCRRQTIVGRACMGLLKQQLPQARCRASVVAADG